MAQRYSDPRRGYGVTAGSGSPKQYLLIQQQHSHTT